MAVRRRSNWYIYFIAFAIALTFAVVAILAFKWYLFPEDSSTVGNTTSGGGSEKFRPTAEDSFNLMTMLSDRPSDSPDLFVMVEYDAVQNRVAFIFLPNGISVPIEGRSLPNVYAAQGAGRVISLIDEVVGVRCDSYIKLDRAGFLSLVSSFGNVDYEVLKTIMIRDGSEIETLNMGVQQLAAESMFRLAMYAQYSEGESYRFNCTGQLYSDLINQNFRNINESLLHTYFEIIMEHAETDITREMFTKHIEALKNTVEYGRNPAEYYVPYGEYTDDGGFKISANSITTIRQKAGLE